MVKAAVLSVALSVAATVLAFAAPPDQVGLGQMPSIGTRPSDREAVRNGQVRDQLRRCSTFSSRHIHVKS